MMKKVLFICLVGIVGSSNLAFAQFSKGDKLFNLGVGVNSYYNGGVPLCMAFEISITEDISVGAGLDFLSYRYNIAGTRYDFTALYIGARGSYHFNRLLNLDVKELDIYAGLGLGYRSFNWKDSYTGTSLGNNYGNSGFFSLHAGVRYYFDPKIGAFIEFGAGAASNARLGVAFKF